MEVILGTIVSTFGIKGEVKVHPNSDFSTKRYKKGAIIKAYSPIKKISESLTVLSYKRVKNVDVVCFKEYDTPESITKLIGYQLLVEKSNEGLANNQYHYADLWHCSVFVNDLKIGEVSDIISTSSSDVLRIARDGKKDLLYPFIARFISEIDIENKRIVLNPIEGMIEL